MTIKQAVEAVARQMDGPRSLDWIVEQALQITGRSKSKSTPATVRDALCGLRFVVKCGPATYGPARVMLDQKALRVKLSPEDLRRSRIRKTQFEPLLTALENPPIETADGRPLRPILLDESKARAVQQALLSALRETLDQLWDLGDYLESMDDEALLEKMDARHMETGYYDLSPALEGWESGDDATVEGADIVIRWVQERGALVVEPQRRSDVDPKQIEAEDQLLADFIASKLTPGHSEWVARLVLEAMATYDALGRTPGSPAVEVIASDPRIRLIGDPAHGLDKVGVAHSDRLTQGERYALIAHASDQGLDEMRARLRARIMEHPRRFLEAWRRAERELGLGDGAAPRRSNVRLLRKPTNEELIREWHIELREAGLSQRVIQRKVNHLHHFVHYLESEAHDGPAHLLDADEVTLESFFFWTYIRRWPSSKSDAETFTLDLRDFYRRQQELGRVPDARFAELIYRVRHMIQERLELYNELLAYDDDQEFDELFETLFFG